MIRRLINWMFPPIPEVQLGMVLLGAAAMWMDAEYIRLVADVPRVEGIVQ